MLLDSTNRLEVSSGASSVDLAGQKLLPGLVPSVSLRWYRCSWSREKAKETAASGSRHKDGSLGECRGEGSPFLSTTENGLFQWRPATIWAKDSKGVFCLLVRGEEGPGPRVWPCQGSLLLFSWLWKGSLITPIAWLSRQPTRESRGVKIQVRPGMCTGRQAGWHPHHSFICILILGLFLGNKKGNNKWFLSLTTLWRTYLPIGAWVAVSSSLQQFVLWYSTRKGKSKNMPISIIRMTNILKPSASKCPQHGSVTYTCEVH